MPMRPDGSTAEKVTVKGIPSSRFMCGMTTFAARTLLLYGSVKALLQWRRGANLAQWRCATVELMHLKAQHAKQTVV